MIFLLCTFYRPNETAFWQVNLELGEKITPSSYSVTSNKGDGETRHNDKPLPNLFSLQMPATHTYNIVSSSTLLRVSMMLLSLKLAHLERGVGGETGCIQGRLGEMWVGRKFLFNSQWPRLEKPTVFFLLFFSLGPVGVDFRESIFQSATIE